MKRADGSLSWSAKSDTLIKGASGAQQMDQRAVDRAVRAAIERERISWQRKLGQGRARFRQMITPLTAMGQSLEKIKESLEEAEREWLTRRDRDTAPRSSVNHRPEQTTKQGVASAESLDGPSKLAAGERRILTALAQYPQGRSKVRWRF
jgi:hypothetical protein